MIRSVRSTLLALVLGLLPVLAAAAPLKIVTTTEGLAALAREVAGDRATVEALSRGVQDPHFVDPNPTLAVKLRNADLLVDVGLELEIGWLPPLVNQSRNKDIQPGGSRRFTASAAITAMDVPFGQVDRSRGDLHPQGNPHFLDSPEKAWQVASDLAVKLGQLDPAGLRDYQSRASDFQKRMGAANQRWQAQLAPVKGQKLFSQHRTLTYFLAWSGLVSAGEIEPRPGVPSPPSHLAELVQVAKREGVKAIVVENYYDTKSASVVAQHSGAKVVQIPGDVGAEPGLGTYEKYMDAVVSRIVGALK